MVSMWSFPKMENSIGSVVIEILSYRQKKLNALKNLHILINVLLSFELNMFRLKNIEHKLDELKTIESSILTQDSRRHSLPSILSAMR